MLVTYLCHDIAVQQVYCLSQEALQIAKFGDILMMFDQVHFTGRSCGDAEVNLDGE